MDFNGTFFVSIISFLVFVLVMNKLLYEPVHKIVSERNNFVDGNYKAADENNRKADELEKERDKKLVEAKEDARVKYNELLDGYKDQRSNIVNNAQDKSRKDLDKAFIDLDNISNETKESLKWKMTDLANDIVEKVLGYRSEVQGFDNEKVNEILYQE